MSYKSAYLIIEKFAQRAGFAIYDKPLQRDDTFIFLLYREDVTVNIARPFPGDDVVITVLPLCACDASKRPHLPEEAKKIAGDLAQTLNPRH